MRTPLHWLAGFFCGAAAGIAYAAPHAVETMTPIALCTLAAAIASFLANK